MLEIDHKFDNAAIIPAGAGFTTGALFKSTRGIRAAMLAGTIGSVAATVYTLGSTYFYDVVMGKGGRF
jgi:hypothetical protein